MDDRLDCKYATRSTPEERAQHKFLRGKGGVTSRMHGGYEAVVHCSCGLQLVGHGITKDSATTDCFSNYYAHRRMNT